jgi:acyl transferase domain-containing protein
VSEGPAPGGRSAGPGGAAEPRPLQLPLSARSEPALGALDERYRDFLRSGAAEHGEDPEWLADVCYTAAVRRTHHQHRVAVQGSTAGQLAEMLERCLQRRAALGSFTGRRAFAGEPRVAFVFSGQGGQWRGMGRGLLAGEPEFRAQVEACDDAVRRLAGWSLLGELTADDRSARADRAEVVQLSIFAVQVGLVALWRSWGLVPEAVIGHSLGEVAAAHAAGGLTLDRACHLLVQRSRLIERAGRGTTVSIALGWEEAERLVAPYRPGVGLAAQNGPRSTVVSGEAVAVRALLAELQGQGVGAQVVDDRYAFHGPQLARRGAALARAVAAAAAGRLEVPFYSTVEGEPVDGGGLDAGYWVRNLCQPVRFAAAVERIIADGYNVFVEVGPHPVLAGHVSAALSAAGSDGLVVPSLRRRQEDLVCLREALCAAYGSGCAVTWPGLYPGGGRHVDLPLYPWQRSRHWFAGGQPAPGPGAALVSPSGGPAAPGVPRPGRRLATAASERRRGLVTRYVRERLAAALELDDPAELDLEQPLSALGLDSLMVVELRRQVEQELGVTVPLTGLPEGTSTADLVTALCAQLPPPAGPPSPPPAGPGRPAAEAPVAISAEEARRMLARLAQMPDAEVHTALLALLDGADDHA